MCALLRRCSMYRCETGGLHRFVEKVFYIETHTYSCTICICVCLYLDTLQTCSSSLSRFLEKVFYLSVHMCSCTAMHMCISLLWYIKNMWNHFVEKVFYINTHMYSCTAMHMRMSLPRYITNKWHHFVSFCGEGVLYEHTHEKLYSYAYVYIPT